MVAQYSEQGGSRMECLLFSDLPGSMGLLQLTGLVLWGSLIEM